MQAADAESLVEMLMDALANTPQWQFLTNLMQADVPQSPDRPPAAAQLSKRTAGKTRYASQPHRSPEVEKWLAMSATDPRLQRICRLAMEARHLENLKAKKYETSEEIREWIRANWPAIIEKYINILQLDTMERQVDGLSARYAKDRADRPSDRHRRIMKFQRDMQNSGKYMTYAQCEAQILT